MAKTLLAFSHFLLIVAFTAAAIPPFFKICGKRNPQLEECIKSSVMKLLPVIKGGYPALDIPVIDPLYIENIDLVNLDNFRASATSVYLHNLSKFVIPFLKVNLNGQRIDMEAFFPSINFKAIYDVKAKILVPIVGQGPIEMTADNVTAKVSMKFKAVERRGVKYVFFTSMSTKLHISDYTAEFMPTEGPEKTLSTAINSVLANSKAELIENTTPNIEKVISSLVLEIGNKICRHFTYDELFPDRE